MTNFEKICGRINASKDLAIDLQKTLTAIPALSPESGGDGELKKAEALIDWLKAHGISDIVRYDAPDARAPYGVRPNVVASVKGAADGDKNAPSVWIISHLDVVPPGDAALWSGDPWTIVYKNGALYGRGAEDNQQGLASSVIAALAFLREDIQPEFTVKLLFAADEETGSEYGIQYLLKNYDLFKANDIILIPDGGDARGETIEIAEKNILWARFVTAGKQTHGSRPDQGNNAFVAGCDLALALHALKDTFNARDSLFDPPYSTFEPTKKEANVPNVNTVPGEDAFYMDMRILPVYSLSEVREEIKRRVEKIEQKYGVSITWRELQANESPATSRDAPVVRRLQSAIKKVYGIDAVPIGIGGGTVGAYLRSAGFDAAVWSRLEETAHQIDEYCLLDNLLGDARVFAGVMLSE